MRLYSCSLSDFIFSLMSNFFSVDACLFLVILFSMKYLLCSSFLRFSLPLVRRDIFSSTCLICDRVSSSALCFSEISLLNVASSSWRMKYCFWTVLSSSLNLSSFDFWSLSSFCR